MAVIALFAHDEKDAAIRRRVSSLQAAGDRIIGFTMRRAERAELGWNEVDLGRTYDANYFQRLTAIARGARRAAETREKLSQADVIYARNLDTALSALAAMKMTGISRPFIYECLDVHRLMTRKDPVGLLMRRLERRILSNSTLLVVSSSAFLREYFDIRHPGRFTPRLIENRILDHPALGERPRPESRETPPLRVGWFGVLRCERSFRLMEGLAARFKGDIEIIMAGYPDLRLRNFHERIRKHFNMRYHGRYKSPEDLSAIYSGVDVVWAGDFHDAGFNSRWLLPNRIYEGGYFATPAIAPADSETGNWIENCGGGHTIGEPIETTLSELIHRLLQAPELITHAQDRLLALPRATFVQPINEMHDVVKAAIMMHGADNRRRNKKPESASSTENHSSYADASAAFRD